MPDYAARIERARAAMEQLGIDLLYLAPGANAQYLSGWRRNRPHFGNVNYPGGWINGLFALDLPPEFRHKVVFSEAWSDGECIMVDPKTGERLGASDARNEGKAVGY